MKLLTDLRDDLTPLLTPTPEWDFENPPMDARELATAMIDLMYKHNGIGLAAPQLGLPHRVFVMRGTAEKGNFVMFNPKIVNLSEEQIKLQESCLSYPGVVIWIKRSRHCRVRFANLTGQRFTEQFTGITARCVQHEIDHLEGRVWYASANKYHKDLGFRQRKKYVKRNPEEVAAFVANQMLQN